MKKIRCFTAALAATFVLLVLSACTVDSGPIENYQEARKVFWSSLYPGNTKSLYCAEQFDSDNRAGFNVEHVFPMSWATKALKCGSRKQCRARSPQFNQIEADLHNLFPARQNVNSARSSFRFGEVRGEARKFGRACDFEVDTRARIAEPTPKVRGDVARAMFYMAHRYKEQGLVIFKKQSQLLFKWHQADPPDDSERKRNDKIESLQGNRNPFIDTPTELDQMISGGGL